tara:strand:- start:1301 stop:1768 length:468 start_codon:yes stop_codon:yes gene_type:complete
MTEIAIFAAGCFWGIEEKFLSTNGVKETEVGYIGGKTENPSYQDVCAGDTYHAEAVRVHYDSDEITYDELLDIFFTIHDPTTLNRQGPDFGTQYRSSIFYLNDFQRLSGENKIKELNSTKFSDSIVTTVEEAGSFWIAEEYHQKYIRKKKQSSFF